MKFILITSFYNGSEFISNLYEKIKNQTYTNWEWIVTDDFSLDNGKEKLLEIANNDRKVKYIEQNFKKEMFYNPQNFCKEAEIIVQIDQDDFPLPKALEVYHYFFTKFPDTIVITCAGNLFKEDGSWMNFHNPDFTEQKNMTCGYLTCLRAWRNNPNINYDFNPNNWMKYYYNDLSILCTLEEQGKILHLPRNLYYYNYRDNSISHSFYGNDSVEEGDILIKKVNDRRPNKNIDTFNRYFESIHKESLCLMDHHLNDVNQQQKIVYIDKQLSFKKHLLLKELFFDHELNINKIDGDEDVLVCVLRDESDLEYFFNIDDQHSIKKIQLIIWSQAENPYTSVLLDKIFQKYQCYYLAACHSIINLIK
jgi:glycosyltransferase involved in cell wall biosynthesis